MNFALLQLAANNYPGAPLNGCLQDLKTLNASFSQLGYVPKVAKSFIDSQMTRKNIISGLEWLIDTKEELKIVQYSGHGARIRSDNDDEIYDSCWVPQDYEKSGLILDDEVAKIFDKLDDNHNLVILSDSCHSGSMQRGFISHKFNKLLKNSAIRSLPEKLSAKYINETRKNTPSAVKTRGIFNKRRKSFIYNNERTVLIATCEPQQTSADAWIDGKWQGAGTAALFRSVSEKNISFYNAARNANKWLVENEYEQILRIEAKVAVRNKPLFLL